MWLEKQGGQQFEKVWESLQKNLDSLRNCPFIIVCSLSSAGITAGNEEFQDAVRLAVPEGQTFKGYPIQFTHRNARKAFTTCLRCELCVVVILRAKP